jgi:hypothetical protein
MRFQFISDGFLIKAVLIVFRSEVCLIIEWVSSQLHDAFLACGITDNKFLIKRFFRLP